MSWRMDRDGAALYEPLSADDIAGRDEEIRWRDDRRKPWKLINGLIEDSIAANRRPWKGVLSDLDAQGVLTAREGGFMGLELSPASGVIATSAAIGATEIALWSTPTYTPIAANPQCPKLFMLRSLGTAVTAATPGSMLFNCRMGQLITSPLLAASVTGAPTASNSSTSWRLEGDVLIRRGGAATNGAAVAGFRFAQATPTTGGGQEVAATQQVFNSTAEVSVETDAALANGLWVGGIATTSTTNTFTPLIIAWYSGN